MKTVLIIALFVLSAIVTPVSARMAVGQDVSRILNSKSSALTADEVADHRVGELVLSVTNIGTFSDGFLSAKSPFDGLEVVGCQFPKNSGIRYCFAGAFWIGAVVGRDTLVSVGADGWRRAAGEMFPLPANLGGKLIHRSLIDPSSPEFDGAISEDDIIATYTDTLTAGTLPDEMDGTQHKPLNIKVRESSFAWSYSYAEDFVLFDYKVENIGFATLKNVYMGIYVDADVGEDATCNTDECYLDDVCGFLHALPETTRAGCTYIDTVNIAWIADNDGDPSDLSNNFDDGSARAVTATRIVRTPSDNLEVSFNWWISNDDASRDFGPREKSGQGELEENFRVFGTGGTGTPEGDRNKYYIMRNREFDYDQVYSSAITNTDPLWAFPNQRPADVQDFSNGFDTRYLLSFGPFTLDPGDVLPISFAYVAGADFHNDPDNGINNLRDSYDPDAYYDNLSFEDLATNARWASWVYDNPGVDTDNDGFSGKFIVCPFDSEFIVDTSGATTWTLTGVETTFISGDGIPDFQGAKPPPAPKLWVTPSVGKLLLRFNGIRSETTPDEFLKVTGESPFDFEGYRVYYSRDERAASFTMISSFDREDFNKWVFPRGAYNATPELLETPFLLAELQALYGESTGTFDPLFFSRTNPFRFGDSLFFFEAQDYNVSQPGVNTKIRKKFPDQPYPSDPSLDPFLADPSELTEDGYFKYFEYEMEIDNLLPTVGYFVNVTAFDYGSPASGLSSLESSVTVGAVLAYAQSSSASIAADNLKVYVYPNPYRINADYIGAGFEGRRTADISRAANRKRAISFANLPPYSTIRIYSIDGDLVSEFEHNVDPSDPDAMHDEWNMITRNTQIVVSGIYYWTVENNETGEVQIGKLAIIM